MYPVRSQVSNALSLVFLQRLGALLQKICDPPPNPLYWGGSRIFCRRAPGHRKETRESAFET